jgi:hypothetical protein
VLVPDVEEEVRVADESCGGGKVGFTLGAVVIGKPGAVSDITLSVIPLLPLGTGGRLDSTGTPTPGS